MPTTQQLEILTSNIDRILLAALEQLGDQILSAPSDLENEPPLSPEEREALALSRLGTMNLDNMDLSALDGIDYDMFSAPASAPTMHAAAPSADPDLLAAALAALPTDLPSLTEPLSEAALAQWLALEQAGSAPLTALITEVRRLSLQQAPWS